MTTIDNVVAAYEELNAAIESHGQTLSFRGSSSTWQLALEDLDNETSNTLWEKFKAFLKRIKEWIFGLFSKKKETIKNLPPKEVAESAAKMDVAAEVKDMHEKTKPAEPVATEKPSEPIKQEPASAPAPEPLPVKEILSEAEQKIADTLRNHFRNKMPNAALFAMIWPNKSDAQAIADNEEFSSRMRETFRLVSNNYGSIEKGYNAGKVESKETQIAAASKDFFDGLEEAREWMKTIDQRPLADLIKIFHRFQALCVPFYSKAKELEDLVEKLEQFIEKCDAGINRLKGSSEAKSYQVSKDFFVREVMPLVTTYNKVLSVYIAYIKEIETFKSLTADIFNITRTTMERSKMLKTESSQLHVELMGLVEKVFNK